ncbi:hypothetical protein E0Z10_g2832 [Xylaria hypoxylon]|uniref:Nucleotide exchange factor SIL1 n=1 Tax=Xylaria hypoxylon TaxID=37992 RepID=A0A4Z0YNP1_9PEZI|nr:hypothetical protein E0Z10_g2832 [Xylaria hypoxylon]
MTTSYLRNLGRLFLSFVFIYSLLCSSASASSPPIASPAAETELICHTDNPAECYPKVFSATEEFQIVHDDQHLPPGLHVQLDVQTGQKQAKLYNPDEENPALAGLPVHQDVIVVDAESPQDDKPRIPAGAPTYEPVGMVKAPREKNEEFSEALRTIKKSSKNQQSIKTSALDGALQLLDDLSHDMYYGLQIAEDAEAVQSLFCLLFRKDEAEGEERSFAERSEFLTSSVLSATVGNNARALDAIEKSWNSIVEKHCEAGSHSIRHQLFYQLAPTSEPGSKQESEEAEVVRLYLTVISGLLRSPKIRTEFLENDGMQSFLQILLRDGGVWESRKAKVAQVISDIFLDEDFGATLGLWPRKQQVNAGICAENGPQSLGDECWAYHLGKIGQGAGAPEWSKHLLSLIQRTQNPGSLKHNEL